MGTCESALSGSPEGAVFGRLLGYPRPPYRTSDNPCSDEPENVVFSLIFAFSELAADLRRSAQNSRIQACMLGYACYTPRADNKSAASSRPEAVGEGSPSDRNRPRG
jgi:hypothetical protein